MQTENLTRNFTTKALKGTPRAQEPFRARRRLQVLSPLPSFQKTASKALEMP